IGASAGGVEQLQEAVHPLPAKLQAAIFVVMHISRVLPSRLLEILAAAGTLKASAVEGGDAIEPSRIYIAPPDRRAFWRYCKRTPRAGRSHTRSAVIQRKGRSDGVDVG